MRLWLTIEDALLGRATNGVVARPIRQKGIGFFARELAQTVHKVFVGFIAIRAKGLPLFSDLEAGLLAVYGVAIGRGGHSIARHDGFAIAHAHGILRQSGCGARIGGNLWV